jgi:dolichol-phosphate mannosyltransferase
MSGKKTLLVLPTLNEEEALKKLISEIPHDFDVLVVDSFSDDDTIQVARESGINFVFVEHGVGQGSGIRTGMGYFLGRGYEYLVIADCDYSDNLGDLPRVVEYLEQRGYDIVLGVRDFKKQREYLGMTTVLVKKTVRFMVWALMGLRVSDVLTGVWVLNRKAVELVSPRLHEVGFQYGFEMLYNAWSLNLRIGETDVDFRRRMGQTKFTLGGRIAHIFYGIEYGVKVIIFRAFRLI